MHHWQITHMLRIGALLCALVAAADAARAESPATSNPQKPFDPTEINQFTGGITEIGIERTMCLGTCPAYWFIARSDGTFTYTGKHYVDHVGRFTGTISQYFFIDVAQFIAESGYWKLPDDYPQCLIDGPEATTLVVMNGERKRVHECGDAPPMLWAIQTLIDDLLETAQWDHPAIGAGRAE